MQMMNNQGVYMITDTKKYNINGFTFKKDESTGSYDKDLLGVRGSATLKLDSNHNGFLQKLIDNAEPQEYKIDGDIGVKIGDIVSVGSGDETINFKIIKLESKRISIGVLINE